MSFGSTSGRGFESAASVYVWGAVVIIGTLLWIRFHFDLRKGDDEPGPHEERDDRDGDQGR